MALAEELTARSERFHSVDDTVVSHVIFSVKGPGMSAEPGPAQARQPAGAGTDPVGEQLRAPTRSEQRTARIMGAWFLGTFVAIPAFFFYDPVLNTSSSHP